MYSTTEDNYLQMYYLLFTGLNVSCLVAHVWDWPKYTVYCTVSSISTLLRMDVTIYITWYDYAHNFEKPWSHFILWFVWWLESLQWQYYQVWWLEMLVLLHSQHASFSWTFPTFTHLWFTECRCLLFNGCLYSPHYINNIKQCINHNNVIKTNIEYPVHGSCFCILYHNITIVFVTSETTEYVSCVK